MTMHKTLAPWSALLFVAACAELGPNEPGATTQESQALVESAMQPSQLAKVRASLPKVAYPTLQAILDDPDTFWYDHESMSPSYQETGAPGGGARDNEHWSDLVADIGGDDINRNPAAGGRRVYDYANKKWRFPVGTTAGTDDATNFYVADFLSLPKDASGKRQAIPVSSKRVDQNHLTWNWQYPNGTTVGEVLYIRDGGNLLPTEVRMRRRYAAGWATNAFRPFAEAKALAAAVKAKRPSWQGGPLRALVEQLEGTAPLAPKRLTAEGLTGTFDQQGGLDVLPDFGDADLVRELLTKTPFVSAYGAVWREAGGVKAFAAGTSSELSIVPKNFTGGLVEVREASCMRCHQEGGRMLKDWYPGLSLYGEVWGKDNIFSFHPFDESYYDKLDLNLVDNRHLNGKLVSAGLVETFDRNKHTGPFYERTAQEVKP